MRTDDLIRALAADRNPALPSATARALLLAAGIGFAVALVPFLMSIGLRPNLGDAAMSPRFLLKPVEMLVLTAAAALLVLRLAQPGAPVRGPLLAGAMAVVLMLAAAGVELLLVPRADWLVQLAGTHWWICVTNMVLLALPMLAALLVGLRVGAPTHPVRAGAAAGSLAGALSATLYIAHCPDDSPLFVAAWFLGAIAIVSAIGAVAGWRLLRW
ncbi:MAG: NrsF family protein [Pseudorhodoplanes sp.]